MRLFGFKGSNGYESVGALSKGNADSYIDLCATDPLLPKNLQDMIHSKEIMDRAAAALANVNAVGGKLSAITFKVPIERPGKIVCMGLNYADHAKEGGNARPEYPSFFMRGPSSMTAHLSPILRPKVSDKLDYEAELAFVVGKKVRHLTLDNALDCIAGYSIFNDGSIRDYQRKTTQWTIGKNFDQTGAFGPWLVTPDELPSACHGLNIQSRLNGQIMQNANTKDFLWGVAETIVLISECMTLEPGDVVITGTPAGVGYARTPPVFMKPGDICEIEIESIGILRNSIADE
ncbi:5-oxopent-3-ene-1,2,5-tricarboxylate decarboxylase [Polynucleobacter wuianus]|uniref:5-oxopent-3-ene-1,2,5-tricarboxylate decarboxylase n=1 Tax=Polynucleobacter wuianus TaxID=1743168 RepID=A0A191UFC3_9BURK|nr:MULTISPECIES: fumarylacetoacetate hydrolase family protein [Polynucleobacter]ANI99601.1 5-oxopent-3-ene-1,2,5-tricarboxylate decarboxylase [Polynucleobacter wuianus]MBU3551759.1 fumarylacetoacetate hydrolase family protein [Polynucleobacter sp. MWH-Post4-6-1]MBU3610728.1 fumarylacetoacetate hydrolase family protein [Polynucleobacter wuianus]